MADNLGVRAYSSPDEGKDFPLLAKLKALEVANRERVSEITPWSPLTRDDVYVVWFAYVLGVWKALVSTTAVDGRYYEVTFNSTIGQIYVDVYKKQTQHVFDHEA